MTSTKPTQAADQVSSAINSDLLPHLYGPAFQPGEPGYEQECAVFNPIVQHQPSVAVGAHGVSDVMTAVRFAGEQGLPVAVLSTGHGVGVRADDAVLINTQRMQGIRIDPTQRTARVEAGVRWERVIQEAAAFGLAPLSGASSHVGVVGYTLGGGIGPLSRAHGYAVDRVRSLDVVTADGQFRQVSPAREPDLYWAFCGGKGNLGVVTSIEFELVEVSRLFGGGLFFRGEDAAKVVHTYREWTATVPDDITSSIALLRLPPVPAVPEALRGQFIVNVRLAYLGSATDGAELIRPLRECAEPAIDAVADMPFTAVGSIHNDPEDPMPGLDRTTYLREFDEAAADALLSVAGPTAEITPLLVEVRHLGGALTRSQGPSNSVGNRQSPFLVFCVSPCDPSDTTEVEQQLDLVINQLAPWSEDRANLNFLSLHDANPERVKMAFDEADYTRLVSIKSEYDPTNMFRINHNVPPASNAG